MGSLQELIKEQGELVRRLKSAKADPAQGFKESLGDIEQALSNYSYLSGWTPSKKDTEFFNLCSTHENGGYSGWPNLKRWFDHMKSFSSEERLAFPELKQSNELAIKVDHLASSSSCDLDKKVRQ